MIPRDVALSPVTPSSASQEGKQVSPPHPKIHVGFYAHPPLIVIITVAFQRLHPFSSSIHHESQRQRGVRGEGEPPHLFPPSTTSEVFPLTGPVWTGGVANSRRACFQSGSAISSRAAFTAGTLPPSDTRGKCNPDAHRWLTNAILSGNKLDFGSIILDLAQMRDPVWTEWRIHGSLTPAEWGCGGGKGSPFT